MGKVKEQLEEVENNTDYEVDEYYSKVVAVKVESCNVCKPYWTSCHCSLEDTCE